MSITLSTRRFLMPYFIKPYCYTDINCTVVPALYLTEAKRRNPSQERTTGPAYFRDSVLGERGTLHHQFPFTDLGVGACLLPVPSPKRVVRP